MSKRSQPNIAEAKAKAKAKATTEQSDQSKRRKSVKQSNATASNVEQVEGALAQGTQSAMPAMPDQPPKYDTLLEGKVKRDVLGPLMAFLGPVGDAFNELPDHMVRDLIETFNSSDGSMPSVCTLATVAVDRIARGRSLKKDDAESFMTLKTWNDLGYSEQEVKASASRFAKPDFFVCNHRELAYKRAKGKLARQLEEYGANPAKYHATLEKQARARAAEFQRKAVADQRAQANALAKEATAREKKAHDLRKKLESRVNAFDNLDVASIKPSRAQYLATLKQECRCVLDELDEYLREGSGAACDNKFKEWEACLKDISENAGLPLKKKLP